MALVRVEGTGSGNGGDLLIRRGLVQQLGQHGRIADPSDVEFSCPDCQGLLVNFDMDFAPDPCVWRHHAWGVPLAFAFNLDASAVDQQV